MIAKKPERKTSIPFLIIALFFIGAGLYLSFSGKWIVKYINLWQMEMNGGGSYYPALTAFIIAIPPLLVLLLLKKISEKIKRN